jgi:HD superfamily phosphodiesterase
MPNDILNEARLFLLNSLRGKDNLIETRHPWRKGWEFAILHSLRVESYTTKILAHEKQSLTEHEITLLRLAAILHDIARMERRDDHAQLGAQKAEKWLKEYAGFSFSGSDIDRVVEMIADHSNKSNPEPDYSKAILKDADTLDEIGVMSIFMAENWVESRSPFFFYDLRQRLTEVEIPFCDKKLAILNTDGAKEILMQRKLFINNFIDQITDELQADPHIEQLVFEISKSSNENSGSPAI